MAKNNKQISRCYIPYDPAKLQINIWTYFETYNLWMTPEKNG